MFSIIFVKLLYEYNNGYNFLLFNSIYKEIFMHILIQANIKRVEYIKNI